MSALVSQNGRRYEAIETAVRRLSHVRRLEREGKLDSPGLRLSELLTKIERDLTEANRHHSADLPGEFS
jgi:hypothetical protein